MTHARQMIEANPSGAAVDATVLVECIEACYRLRRRCPSEQDVQTLIRCVRLDLDWTDIRDRQDLLQIDGLRL